GLTKPKHARQLILILLRNEPIFLIHWFGHGFIGWIGLIRLIRLIRGYLIFKEASATNISTTPKIQNLTVTFDSAMPLSSKWWCSGAILKTRLPLKSLKELIWMITDSVSSTNTPPTIGSSSSCFT